MKTLETPRLLLRPFTLQDAEDTYREIYSDAEVVQYYSSLGVQTLEQVRARIASYMGAWAKDDLGRHAVILKEGQGFIGQVHLNGYVNSFARWKDEPNPPFNPLEVQLAVLQLTQGNPHKLLQMVEAAKKDYRDVLYWASNQH
jgi:RimJ/RimL family protein N-acetyltransferase